MNEVFKPYLMKFILVFFDDILVYSRSYEEHSEHVKLTLQLLKDHSLFAKRSKCVLGIEQVQYLGHIINKDGVSTDPDKVSCMTNWPLPNNIKRLRGFLGLTGYCRRFIKDYGLISRPFY